MNESPRARLARLEAGMRIRPCTARDIDVIVFELFGIEPKGDPIRPDECEPVPEWMAQRIRHLFGVATACMTFVSD